VQVDSKVKAGDALVIIESMKMEIAVSAPCDGEIVQLNCRTGGQVAAGQDLLIIRSGE
jgi:urea carboxylase